MDQAAFKRRFEKSVFARLHMSLLMLATVLSGLLFSKLLWLAGLANMAWRFPLVLLLSYGCFFVLMRLWLIYLTHPFTGGPSRPGGGPDFHFTTLGSGSSSGGSGGAAGSPYQGGSSGGGGASGSWDAPAAALVSAQASSGQDTTAHLAGEALSGASDSDNWIFLVIGLVLLIVFGSSVYLIYQAPAILSEAAFQVLLAAGLFKKARKMDDANWVGSVLRHTWKPFALVLAVTTILGVVLHKYCPLASRLSEVSGNCM